MSSRLKKCTYGLDGKGKNPFSLFTLDLLGSGVNLKQINWSAVTEPNMTTASNNIVTVTVTAERHYMLLQTAPNNNTINYWTTGVSWCSSVSSSTETCLISEDCDLPQLVLKPKKLLPTTALPAQPLTPPTHRTPTPILPFLCISSLPFIKQKTCSDTILQTRRFLPS